MDKNSNYLFTLTNPDNDFIIGYDKKSPTKMSYVAISSGGSVRTSADKQPVSLYLMKSE